MASQFVESVLAKFIANDEDSETQAVTTYMHAKSQTMLEQLKVTKVTTIKTISAELTSEDADKLPASVVAAYEKLLASV